MELLLCFALLMIGLPLSFLFAYGMVFSLITIIGHISSKRR